jgi:hypothetical protein
MTAYAANPGKSFRLVVATALAIFSWTAQSGCVGRNQPAPPQKASVIDGGSDGSVLPRMPSNEPDLEQLERTIDADPGALRAVFQYVELKKGLKDNVDEYCRELAKKSRAAQAMECVQTAKTTDTDTWLQVLASLPSLSLDRTQELIERQKALGDVLWGVATCEDPRNKAMTSGPRVDPRTVLIYLQLSDDLGGGNNSPKAMCFLSFAAVACLQALAEAEECPDPSVPTLYAQALSPYELKVFEEEIFSEKTGLYRKLSSANDGTSRSRQVALTLLKLHAVLARLYSTEEAGSKPWQQRAYHVRQIVDLWLNIHPDRPLPESLGISKSEEAEEACLRPFWKKLEQDRADCESEIRSGLCRDCRTPPHLLVKQLECMVRVQDDFEKASEHCQDE